MDVNCKDIELQTVGVSTITDRSIVVQVPNDGQQHSKNENIYCGKSLLLKTVDQLMKEAKFRVVGVIEITNFTNYKLTDPCIHTNGGRVSVKPQDVEPLTQEAVVVHKYPLTATGSYGTLSFYIQQLRCRVILMWSLPFNHVLFSNWLALDIRSGRLIDHINLFDAMYHDGEGKLQKYDKFCGDTHFTRHFTRLSRGIKLTASMTDSHKAHIEFKVQEH